MSERFDVTSLGETMLRLSVPSGERLEMAQQFAAYPGGAESNVGAALTSLGRRCGWVSRVPDNALGHWLLRQLRAAGIDTSAVVLAPGSRLGVYYAEFAGPPRATQVIYDRAHAAVTRLSPENIDWAYLLDTRLLHLSGITPALSEGCRLSVQEALRRAKNAGVPVSFDVNYRGKLWSAGAAERALTPLIQEVDLLICGEADAATLFGLRGEDKEVLAGLRERSGAQHIILTLGERGALAYSQGEYLFESALNAQVVDRFGAGDALAAGILEGYLSGSLAEGLRLGVALAALAIAQRGDMLLTNRAEVEAVRSAAPKRISR